MFEADFHLVANQKFNFFKFNFKALKFHFKKSINLLFFVFSYSTPRVPVTELKAVSSCFQDKIGVFLFA